MRCKGICEWISFDSLPTDSSWTDQNSFPWSQSHGTPTVSPSSIWMWSYNGRGEGVNLAHNFVKDEEYCIDGVFSLDTHNGNQAP